MEDDDLTYDDIGLNPDGTWKSEGDLTDDGEAWEPDLGE